MSSPAQSCCFISNNISHPMFSMAITAFDIGKKKFFILTIKQTIKLFVLIQPSNLWRLTGPGQRHKEFLSYLSSKDCLMNISAQSEYYILNTKYYIIVNCNLYVLKMYHCNFSTIKPVLKIS